MAQTRWLGMVAFALLIAAGAWWTPGARGDVIGLIDGRYIYGEIVEQTKTHIVIRTRVERIWTSLRFSRTQVDFVGIEEGDQSDLAEHDAGEPGRPQAQPADEAMEPGLPRVMLIPLHGTVGGVSGKSLLHTFDAAVIEACLDEAERGGALAVVLDIQSPGGLVSEMEAICEAIIQRHGRLRIIAYPGDAFSAAAIIAMCCREMVVRPNARIGAAVIVGTRGGGITAVDAKMASPHYAKQRQYMRSSGRPYEVVEAMTIQETQLWWSPLEGFRTSQPAMAEAADWMQVDGRSTVLTMTADQAVKWKIARGMSPSLAGALRHVGITQDVDVVNLKPLIDKHNKQLDSRLQDLIKQLNNYFSAMVELAARLNKLHDAYARRDREAANLLKSEIGQQIAKLTNAGRSIQRIDRSILARRVELPDQVLEQMKSDAEMLSRINRLLKTDTIDGFNESADRCNAVLDSWKKLLAN